jgi:isopentenyl-diphosphate delta-isomerase
LHRAFSVFLYRHQAGRFELLLQQRAATKYHGPNLWSNACCSHPRQGEHVLAASQRRLQEELGINAQPGLVGHFQYKAHFANGLIEHEYDYVLVGEFEGAMTLNPEEVAAVQWLTVDELQCQVKANPEQFTPWLMQALQIAMPALSERMS